MKDWKKCSLIAMLCLMAGMLFWNSNGVASEQEHVNGFLADKEVVANKKDTTDDIQKTNRKKGIVIPNQYDARAMNQLMPIRNQGKYGTCWSFSALGVAESVLRAEGYEDNPDLSELQLAYFLGNMPVTPMVLDSNINRGWYEQVKKNLNNGGNYSMATNALSQWGGVVPEEEAVYEDLQKEGTELRLADNLMFGKNTYQLVNMEKLYMGTPNRIKEKILKYGAVAASIHMYAAADIDDICNKDQTAVCSLQSVIPNHAVMIVGWDDNYAVTNFNEKNRPSKPGAWLIRNSWGEKFNDKGYLWISYEDYVLAKASTEVYFFQMKPAEEYDNNYCYDQGLTTALTNRNYKKMANNFTTQSNEKLKAVAFEISQRNVDYEIRIYKNSDESNPESGTQVGDILYGTAKEIGYHTIDFTENGASDITLSQGDKFSVVIALSDENGKPVNLSYEQAGSFSFMSDAINCKNGESQLCQNEEWKDCNELYGANLRIKAFTSNVSKATCTSLQIAETSIAMNYGEQKNLSVNAQPLGAPLMKVEWSSSDESVVRVFHGTVFAVGEGNAIVTAKSGEAVDTVSIDVSKVYISGIQIPTAQTLIKNVEHQLMPILTPVKAAGRLYWSSSDNQKVNVTEEGVLRPLVATDTPVTITVRSDNGQTASCEITVTEAPEEIELEKVQSYHPYCINSVQRVTFQRPNAIGYDVTFSDQTYVERNADYIDIYDEKDNRIARYTGMELAGQKIHIDGSKFTISISTDGGLEMYGFAVTDIKVTYGVVTTPTPIPTAVPTIAPTIAPTVVPTVSPTPTATVKKNVVKKLSFKKKSITKKAGKTVSLQKFLKITKNRTGNAKITYSFTNGKYKKYAVLKKSGLVKCKKAGIGKTIRVVAKAGDGSKKKAYIKIKIQK